jgi:hypothetical protein
LKKTVVVLLLAVMGASVFAQWGSDVEFDIMYNTKKITLVSQAAIGQNAYNKKPTMLIRLNAGELDIYIFWGEYLGSDDYVSVISRYDDTSPTRERWLMSSTGTATFMDGDLKAKLKELAGKKSFFASVSPYNSNQIVVSFNLDGLLAELEKYPEFKVILE